MANSMSIACHPLTACAVSFVSAHLGGAFSEGLWRHAVVPEVGGHAEVAQEPLQEHRRRQIRQPHEHLLATQEGGRGGGQNPPKLVGYGSNMGKIQGPHDPGSPNGPRRDGELEATQLRQRYKSTAPPR
jgi:hypothetical protein